MKKLILLIMLISALFASAASAATEQEIEDYWEAAILSYNGAWIPDIFSGVTTYVDGARMVVWPEEGFDWTAVDAYFSATPFSIKANCGGGCNVMLGSYWFLAYEAAPLLEQTFLA